LQCSEFGDYGAVSFEWNRSKETAQRDHANFLTQRFEISADKAVGMLSDFLKIYIIGERHGARVDLENLQTCLIMGTPISISRSKRPGRRSAGSRTSGMFVRADHDDLPARYEAIHQAEQLRHHALFDFANNFGAFGSHRVISSMNRIAGAWRAAASSKTSRSLASLSP